MHEYYANAKLSSEGEAGGIDGLSEGCESDNSKNLAQKKTTVGAAATLPKALADHAVSKAEMDKMKSEEKSTFTKTDPETATRLERIKVGFKDTARILRQCKAVI